MNNETTQQFNSRVYESKKNWHRDQAQLPIREKTRLMLRMQKEILPLISKHRTLEWFEKPWDIEP